MKWTDEKIKEELLKSIKILGIDRMPTGNELKSIGRNDLHCKISRTKKYSGWAEELGLKLKTDNETRDGEKHEKFIYNKLTKMGYKVERMSHKHPYDLLVNDAIKIDVKSAKPYLSRGSGSRVHTFSLNKDKPTCDIYILVALDEKSDYERIFVIPSYFIPMKMINLGTNSKYNRFINAWDYIKKFDDFYKSIE